MFRLCRDFTETIPQAAVTEDKCATQIVLGWGGDGLFSSMFPFWFLSTNTACWTDGWKRFPGWYMAGKKTAAVFTHWVSDTVFSKWKALQEAVVPQTWLIVRLWTPVSSEDALCLKTFCFLCTYAESWSQCLRGLSLGLTVLYIEFRSLWSVYLLHVMSFSLLVDRLPVCLWSVVFTSPLSAPTSRCVCFLWPPTPTDSRQRMLSGSASGWRKPPLTSDMGRPTSKASDMPCLVSATLSTLDTTIQ